MLNIEASQIFNLSVKSESDRRTVRKIDVIPLVKPDDWIDPYPDAQFSDIVAVILSNKRVTVKGIVRAELKPQPFTLVHGGVQMEFLPIGRWESSSGAGSQSTEIEGIHYVQPEPTKV